MFFIRKTAQMPSAGEALPGRDRPLTTATYHSINGAALVPPYPDNTELALFGCGCFWGAERLFWQTKGVYVTAVGYAGGYTPHPVYAEVCSGQSGHNEVVRVVFHPEEITYQTLLQMFWEQHDPTQGMRQGNDAGTQYRSGIYTYSDAQYQSAQQSKERCQTALTAIGYGSITTEIIKAPEFYFAENYHQQYLAKNPSGYCGLKGTGIRLTCQTVTEASDNPG